MRGIHRHRCKLLAQVARQCQETRVLSKDRKRKRRRKIWANWRVSLTTLGVCKVKVLPTYYYKFYIKVSLYNITTVQLPPFTTLTTTFNHSLVQKLKRSRSSLPKGIKNKTETFIPYII
jgi:uncharacterized membrane protein